MNSTKKIAGVALAGLMAVTSFGVFASPASAAPADLTISSWSWIYLGVVTDITPDCVNPGDLTAGVWTGAISCAGVAGAMDILIEADAVVSPGGFDATFEMDNIEITVDGTAIFWGVCTISLFGPRTLVVDGWWNGGFGMFTDDLGVIVDDYYLDPGCTGDLETSILSALGTSPSSEDILAEFYISI